MAHSPTRFLYGNAGEPRYKLHIRRIFDIYIYSKGFQLRIVIAFLFFLDKKVRCYANCQSCKYYTVSLLYILMDFD